MLFRDETVKSDAGEEPQSAPSFLPDCSKSKDKRIRNLDNIRWTHSKKESDP